MTNISINMTNKTIVITKAFAKAASRYGSEEYKDLKAAQNDNPSYKIVIRKTSSKESFKGLTYNFMENYITSHKTELLEEFKTMINKSENPELSELAATSYGEVRTWFLGNFPEIEEFYDKRAKSIEKASKARKAAKEARRAA